jgi:hypothetical protein
MQSAIDDVFPEQFVHRLGGGVLCIGAADVSGLSQLCARYFEQLLCGQFGSGERWNVYGCEFACD